MNPANGVKQPGGLWFCDGNVCLALRGAEMICAIVQCLMDEAGQQGTAEKLCRSAATLQCGRVAG